MTFVHWLQGLWLVIVAAQLVQMYFMRRAQHRFHKATEMFERINATLGQIKGGPPHEGDS